MSSPRPTKRRRVDSEALPSLESARQASAARLLDSWTALEAKYCHNGPQARDEDTDDLVDIWTGKVVVDRGVLRGIKGTRALGGVEAEENESEGVPEEVEDEDEMRDALAREKERLKTRACVEDSDDDDELDFTSPRKKKKRKHRAKPSFKSPPSTSSTIAADDDSDDELDLLGSSPIKRQSRPLLSRPTPGHQLPTPSPSSTPPVRKRKRPSVESDDELDLIPRASSLLREPRTPPPSAPPPSFDSDPSSPTVRNQSCLVFLP